MVDVRKFWPCPQFHSLFLILLALSIFSVAQDKDAKEKDSAKRGSKKAETNYPKIKGKVRCDKPETAPSIDVPDRPGHAVMIEKRKCTWTEPMELQGSKSKEGVMVGFEERMEGSLHTRGFEVDKLDSGEDLTMHIDGQIAADKGPTSGKGRWNFMRGTGKFKGISGGGTYEIKLDADNVWTLVFEGIYVPTEKVGEKK
jgi:hypothetical protein